MDINAFAQASAKGELFDAEGDIVPAQKIMELLDGTTYPQWPVKRRAVRLTNATVTGRLELQSLECICPLELLNCQIPQGIDARAASIKWLVLSGSKLGDLDASNITIDRRLAVDDDFEAQGAVVLRGASIGRSLSACRGTFLNPGEWALDLTDAVVGGSVNLERARVVGSMALLGAKLGSLVANQATFWAANRPGDRLVDSIDARNVTVSGDFAIGDGFQARGRVRLTDAAIGGQLRGSNSQIGSGGHDVALDGEDMTVAGSVTFADGFKSEGEVVFNRAHVTGDLILTNASLRSVTGWSVRAESIRVDGSVRCNRDGSRSFASIGQIQFDGAAIKGDFDCSAASFMRSPRGTATSPRVASNGQPLAPISFFACQLSGSFDASHAKIEGKTGYAIDANGATIGQSFVLANAKVLGTIDLVGAVIGQQLNCEGAQISHPETAIVADGVRVGTDLLLRASSERAFAAHGSIVLVEGVIGGDLSCRGGQFVDHKRAIDARGVTVGAETWLDSQDTKPFRFSAKGAVHFERAKLTGRLQCVGASFQPAKEGDIAFAGTGMSIGSVLSWKGMTANPSGQLLLDDVSVQLLDDDIDSWPRTATKPLLSINGFTYNGLAPGAFDDVNVRLEWVRRSTYALQPYQQLRAFYSNSGRPKDARAVAIAKEDDRRKRGGQLRGLRSIGHQASRELVRYGYQPLRAGRYLIILVLLAAAVFAVAHQEGVMMPTQTTGANQALVRARCTDTYPCFSPEAYGFDIVVPIISLGQRDNWNPDLHHRYGLPFVLAAWTFTILGWLIVTMAVAGVTGWLSPDPKTG
jgi:hypothetical protein